MKRINQRQLEELQKAKEVLDFLNFEHKIQPDNSASKERHIIYVVQETMRNMDEVIFALEKGDE